MPTYGGIRQDFKPPQYNLALGEDWPLCWVVEDEDGVPLTSFAGMAWGFAILERREVANGWANVLAAALHSETSAGGGISAAFPNVDLTVTGAEQAAANGAAGLQVRPYAYELWQLSAPVRRVAFGDIVPQA